MRPLWTFFVVAIAACHARPIGQYGDYVHQAHPPSSPLEDDFSHRFRYKEYFPPPPKVSVGSSYQNGKLYADSHAYPSIGHQFDQKPYDFKDTYPSYSQDLGEKDSYVASAIPDPFKGYQSDSYKYIYADGHGEYGNQGYDKLGAIAHGVGQTLSGPIAAIKQVQGGITDTISHAAKSVTQGIGQTINSAVHTAKVAGADLTDHLSRTAVHVQKGISGTITDTTYTAKSLFDILREFLGKNIIIIRDSAGRHFDSTRHALSHASAVVVKHIARTALGVGEFLQNKAHEINVSINKKVHRDDEHIPIKYDEQLSLDVGPGIYDDAKGVSYGVQKSAYLFEPTKIAVTPIPILPAPVPIVSAPQYVSAASYTKF